ncbi:MAG: hypothetical protein QOG55_1565 [Acidobacteriaceae bacterium]|jgi:hypothetical protein|nr:hypothetical protein [Acidobacteriaceae bacterium]
MRYPNNHSSIYAPIVSAKTGTKRTSPWPTAGFSVLYFSKVSAG